MGTEGHLFIPISCNCLCREKETYLHQHLSLLGFFLFY